MFISDDEKDDRKEALRKLADVMSSEMGKKLGASKKPMAASLTIEKMDDDHDMGRGMDDDMDENEDEENEDPRFQAMEDKYGDLDDDGEEPSHEDKMKIAELYHKFCK